VTEPSSGGGDPGRRSTEQLLAQWGPVFEHAGWGVAVTMDRQHISAVNPALARMLGYAMDELVGRPIADVFAPASRHQLAAIAAHMRTRDRYTFESAHLRRDGTVFPVRVDITAVRDAQGGLRFGLVSVQDLTERVEHEHALRAAAMSGDVLDRLVEGCTVVGFDYTYLYVNDVAAAHGRTARAQLIGRTMMACYPGVEHTALYATLQRCMTERCSAQLETEYEFVSGARALFELKFVPVPQGVCIFSLDLAVRQHRLAAIVEDSEDAIASIGLDGQVTSWNGSAARMFGYTANDVLGQHYARLFGDLPVPDPAALARVAAGERIPAFETVRTAPNGERLDLSVTVSPYRDFTGSVVGTSLTMRDITELKQTQRELVAAVNAAEAVSRELEAFAFSVAHDLRAPLRHINGLCLALDEDSGDQLDSEGRRRVQRIRASTELMAQLIDDLLKLSRISQQTMARRPVDLSALARAAGERLRQREPERQVELVIADDLVAAGDAPLLTVALDNLLGNAWKFSARRPDARIEVGSEVRDGVVTFHIRDNGAGFDMAHARHLFMPFHRLHGPEFAGTGIGLATVRRVVVRHGGTIWAEAAVDAGATFYFTLGAAPL
jgi:PAS domain S-box-containing protein